MGKINMKSLEAQLVLVPGLLLQHLEGKDAFVSDLLDLEKMVELFGLETTASFISLGRLYNSKSSKNLLGPVLQSFQTFDWMAEPMTVLRDKNPELAIRLTKVVDGQILQGKEVSDQFILGALPYSSNVMDKDIAVPKQLYVPEIFLIKGHTYGVRLNAVTCEADEADMPSFIADTLVSLVNQLGKFFNVREIASTALFKEHVKTAML